MLEQPGGQPVQRFDQGRSCRCLVEVVGECLDLVQHRRDISVVGFETVDGRCEVRCGPTYRREQYVVLGAVV